VKWHARWCCIACAEKEEATKPQKVLGWSSTDPRDPLRVPHTPPQTKTTPDKHPNLAAISAPCQVPVSFDGMTMYLLCIHVSSKPSFHSTNLVIVVFGVFVVL